MYRVSTCTCTVPLGYLQHCCSGQCLTQPEPKGPNPRSNPFRGAVSLAPDRQWEEERGASGDPSKVRASLSVYLLSPLFLS